MERIDKLIRTGYVLIAGVSLTTVLLAIDKGLIKIPTNNNHNDDFIETGIGLNSVGNELLKEEYHEYVKLVADEIKLSDMDRSVGRIFATYMYLIKKGYIIYGDKISHDVKYEDTSNLGMNVASGEGVCRNLSANLKEIFEELGYNAYIVCGELYSKEEKSGEVNHCVCYVEDNGHSYLFDPANDTIFFRKGNKFVSMNDDNIYFRPSYTFDQKMGYYPDNRHVYFNLENCYNELKCWFFEDYPTYIKEAEKNNNFYFNYENEYLLPYEREIHDALSEYYMVHDEISNNKNYKLKFTE